MIDAQPNLKERDPFFITLNIESSRRTYGSRNFMDISLRQEIRFSDGGRQGEGLNLVISSSYLLKISSALLIVLCKLSGLNRT